MGSESGVFMDIDAVQVFSDGFSAMSDVMKTASQGLEIAIDTLRASAMFGLIGNLAVANYLDGIKPRVDNLATKFEEVSHDLIGAIVSYRDGDTSGSQHFVG
jgi:phage-related protein